SLDRGECPPPGCGHKKVHSSQLGYRGENQDGHQRNHMERESRCDQTNVMPREIRTRHRIRRPLPPQETRDWMTPREVSETLGCSVATLHRLRRGLIPGSEPLPFCQYGRKIVFRKLSI